MYIATKDSGKDVNFFIIEANEPPLFLLLYLLSMYSKTIFKNPSVSIQSIYLTILSCFNFFSRFISDCIDLYYSSLIDLIDTYLIATRLPYLIYLYIHSRDLIPYKLFLSILYLKDLLFDNFQSF